MKIHRIDHVGIIVNDLPAAKAFFLELGLEVMGEAGAEGEWVERIIGLENVKEDVVMMQTPDGEANIELVKFHSPLDETGCNIPARIHWESVISPLPLMRLTPLLRSCKNMVLNLSGKSSHTKTRINYATSGDPKTLYWSWQRS